MHRPKIWPVVLIALAALFFSTTALAVTTGPDPPVKKDILGLAPNCVQENMIAIPTDGEQPVDEGCIPEDVDIYPTDGNRTIGKVVEDDCYPGEGGCYYDGGEELSIYNVIGLYPQPFAFMDIGGWQMDVELLNNGGLSYPQPFAVWNQGGWQDVDLLDGGWCYPQPFAANTDWAALVGSGDGPMFADFSPCAEIPRDEIGDPNLCLINTGGWTTGGELCLLDSGFKLTGEEFSSGG